MPDDPWCLDLSPGAMPEGWEFRGIRYRRELPPPNACEATLSNWSLFVNTSGYGSTPGAALADAIRKAKEHPA